MGLGGVLFAIQSNRAQEQAAVETAAVPPTPIPPTATPTSTATPTATITPEPTATSTPVISGETAAQEQVVQPTEETETEEIEPETEVVEEVETAEVEPVEVTPTNTRVLADATSTDTALAQASTPSPPTEIIPSSGGVLPQANNNFLLLITGILVVVLSVYGAIYRTR